MRSACGLTSRAWPWAPSGSTFGKISRSALRNQLVPQHSVPINSRHALHVGEQCVATWFPCLLRSVGAACVAALPRSQAQDVNPIGKAWRELRVRLCDTQPADMEPRRAFIARLRSAVTWLNRNRADFFFRICNSQVEWADDIRKARGARTHH